MAEVILMPGLSDTMTEGVIDAWHKNVGDAVKKGDLLAEIETDKATMELESYHEGVLLHVGTHLGGKLQVNDLLAVIGKQGEDISEILFKFQTNNADLIREEAIQKREEEYEKIRKESENELVKYLSQPQINESYPIKYIFNRNEDASTKIIGTTIVTTIIMIFIGINNQLYLPINKFNPDIELVNIITIIFQSAINIVIILLLILAEIAIFFIVNYAILSLNSIYFKEKIKEKSDKTNFYLIILLFPIFCYLLLGRFLFHIVKLIETFTLKIITHSNYKDLDLFDSSIIIPIKDYKVNNWKDINVYYIVFFPLIIPIVLTLKFFHTMIILILILLFEIGGVFTWILNKLFLILEKCNNLINSIWNEINRF
jgi:hypothetical protein